MDENSSIEETYADKQTQMMNDIIDVFAKHDANIFEMYRALSVMKEVAEQQAREAYKELGGQIDELISALGDVKGALELVDEEADGSGD